MAVRKVAPVNRQCRVHVGEQRLQPPFLHAAEHHEAGKEEADQQPFAQDQRRLMLLVGMREAKEEQQQREEDYEVVVENDDGCEEGEMHGDDPDRHIELTEALR